MEGQMEETQLPPTLMPVDNEKTIEQPNGQPIDDPSTNQLSKRQIKKLKKAKKWLERKGEKRLVKNNNYTTTIKRRKSSLFDSK